MDKLLHPLTDEIGLPVVKDKDVVKQGYLSK